MTRTSTIVTLAVLSSILTPVVVKATSAETRAASQEVSQPKVETAMVTTAAQAQDSRCSRQVKVVYGGFGEVHAAACATTADLRR